MTDTRCPRCYRSDVRDDQGALRPHKRLSSDGLPTSAMVWCAPIVVARSSQRHSPTCEPRGAA